MKKNKELKDNWRYDFIGEDTWKLENHLNYSPEEQYISSLDGEETELSSSMFHSDELHKAIDRLPERYRSILWAYHFEGKSFGRIGRENGYTKQYAFQEYTKALELMKELLK